LNIDFYDTNIYFATMNPRAKIPAKREEDGCYDLYAYIDQVVEIPPHGTALVNTGLCSAFSPNYRIRICSRGTNTKMKSLINAGVIDSGYRGEWFVALVNTTDKFIYLVPDLVTDGNICENETAIYFPTNKAIAQFAIEEVPRVKIVGVTKEEIEKFDSERGSGKLGSTEA